MHIQNTHIQAYNTSQYRLICSTSDPPMIRFSGASPRGTFKNVENYRHPPLNYHVRTYITALSELPALTLPCTVDFVNPPFIRP